MWRRIKCLVWIEDGLVSARSALNHTQLGRAGLAWGWMYEAWRRIVVWGYSGNGSPRQRCSMVTCLSSAWHHICQNVRVCVWEGVCVALHVCVCVSREFMPTLCLVASRDGAGLASCWGTQEAELEENMTYIAIREKRILSFHNAHRSTLQTDVYSTQMHNMFSFSSDIIS